MAKDNHPAQPTNHVELCKNLQELLGLHQSGAAAMAEQWRTEHYGGSPQLIGTLLEQHGLKNTPDLAAKAAVALVLSRGIQLDYEFLPRD